MIHCNVITWKKVICKLVIKRNLEKEMTTHSRILAWKIPQTEEPGGLPSVGSQRVRRDSAELNKEELLLQKFTSS